jgi:hypothetical protein
VSATELDHFKRPQETECVHCTMKGISALMKKTRDSSLIPSAM